MNTLPNVSVIMPIRNEADFIQCSLGAVLVQDYPHDRLEILIVDGLSSDETRKIIVQSITDSDIIIKLLDNPKQIVPTGFNIALREAAGDMIVRVDGHTIIAKDYIRQCVNALMEEPNASNVGGRMEPISRTAFGKAVATATTSTFGVGGARFHYSTEREWVDTVYLGAWRRETFEKLGRFDEEFVRNQDDEFNYRLRGNGGKILLSPAIKSQYYNRANIRSLWRQYYEYGYWKVRVLQKHPRQMRPRQFVPVLFVGALIVSSLLAILLPIGCWLLNTILGVYVVANLVYSIREAFRCGFKDLAWLPLVYTVLHLSYGFGFFHGLIAFRKRWERGVYVP